MIADFCMILMSKRSETIFWAFRGLFGKWGRIDLKIDGFGPQTPVFGPSDPHRNARCSRQRPLSGGLPKCPAFGNAVFGGRQGVFCQRAHGGLIQRAPLAQFAADVHQTDFRKQIHVSKMNSKIFIGRVSIEDSGSKGPPFLPRIGIDATFVKPP